MKQLSQLGATAKGLPLQIIKLRRGNPLWLPQLIDTGWLDLKLSKFPIDY